MHIRHAFLLFASLPPLGSGAAGCGETPPPPPPSRVSAVGPHQGPTLVLPKRAGLAELVNEPEPADRDDVATSLVIYFLAPDGKTPLTPAPAEVRIDLDLGGGKSETLELRAEPRGGDPSGGPGSRPEPGRTCWPTSAANCRRSSRAPGSPDRSPACDERTTGPVAWLLPTWEGGKGQRAKDRRHEENEDDGTEANDALASVSTSSSLSFALWTLRSSRPSSNHEIPGVDHHAKVEQAFGPHGLGRDPRRAGRRAPGTTRAIGSSPRSPTASSTRPTRKRVAEALKKHPAYGDLWADRAQRPRRRPEPVLERLGLPRRRPPSPVEQVQPPAGPLRQFPHHGRPGEQGRAAARRRERDQFLRGPPPQDPRPQDARRRQGRCT